MKENIRNTISIFIVTLLLIFKDVVSPLQDSLVQLVVLSIVIVSVFKYSKFNQCIFWYLIFAIYTAFSYYYYGKLDSLTPLANTFLYVLSYSFLCYNYNQIKNVFRSFALGGLILFPYLLVKYYSILGHGRLGDLMIETTYQSSIQFSYYIITILISAIIVVLQDFKNKYLLIIAILCILSGFTISIFNGAKKGYLIPVFFIVFYHLIGLRKNVMKNVVALVGAFFIVYLVWEQVKSIDLLQRYFVERVESMIAFFFVGEGADIDTSTSTRVKYIPTAINAFLNNPIWGMGGLGNSTDFFYRTIQASHPHNNYLNLLASGGIILFLIFYWFPFKIAKNILKLVKNDKKCTPHYVMFSLMISILFNDLSSSTFNIPVIILLYAVSYKYILWCNLKNQYSKYENIIRK